MSALGKTAGARLRLSIQTRGCSLAAFSRMAAVPYRSLQDYVADKCMPGFDQLAKFAVCGLDINYILTGAATDLENNSLPLGYSVSVQTVRQALAMLDPATRRALLLELVTEELRG